MEHYWAGNISRTSGDTTVFVGTGLFTDAGSISPSGVVTLSKGGFSFINTKPVFKVTVNPTTCFLTYIYSATASVGRGTGAYSGISGPLSWHGQVVAVLPRLKNGKCNETSNVVPINVTGEISGSSTLTLPAPVTSTTTTTG
ncbi:MAG: hypothetical protein ACLP36_07870 [Acidimicrobiales bacterium]